MRAIGAVPCIHPTDDPMLLFYLSIMPASCNTIMPCCHDCMLTTLKYTHTSSKMAGFSVQIGRSNAFGRMPVDQAIEKTVDKDMQTTGRISFSLKPGAATRYYLTSEYQNKQLRVVMTTRSIITRPCPGKMGLMCSYWFS